MSTLNIKKWVWASAKTEIAIIREVKKSSPDYHPRRGREYLTDFNHVAPCCRHCEKG
jgi:hypothetical protein